MANTSHFFVIKRFNSAILLLFGMILCTIVTVPASAEPVFNLKDNIDYLGSDYKSFVPKGNDIYACVAACKSETACMAFTYVHPGVKGPQAICYLKNAQPAASVNNCCISGRRSKSPGQVIIIGPQMTSNSGLDYPGGDYKRLLSSVAKPEECANACKQDKKCKSYTYVNPGVQGPAAVCYLKADIRPSTNNTCCISGIKSYLPNALDDVSLVAGIDLPGSDYKSMTLSKPDPYTCAYACKQNQKCRAYTFVNPQGGQPAKCYLKKAVPAQRNSSCCVSGVKTPDSGLKTALTRGALPAPDWAQCSGGGALDVLDKLCLPNFLPGFTCKAPGPQSKCATYTRQIPVGAGVSGYHASIAPPMQSFDGYTSYGARGKALGEAMLCSLRELSPAFVGPSGKTGKTMSVGWSGKNFLGDLSFRQDVGYKDFHPKTLKFEGYRNLSFCAPIVGCYDAVAQDFSVKLDNYKVVPPIKFSAPPTKKTAGPGNILIAQKVIALDQYYALTVSSEMADKSVTLLPPSFTVVTPLGVITVQPSFTYNAREYVSAPPFQAIDTVKRTAGEGAAWHYPVDLTDIFGVDNAIAFPLLHPGKGIGWQSQLALGNRDARSIAMGSVWSPTGTTPTRPDRELRTARDNGERTASAEISAKARLSFPEPKELKKYLPSWMIGGNIEFEIWVEPEARAAFSSQFDILAAHGRQPEAGDMGAGGSYWSAGDLAMMSNVANSFGFNLATGVNLKVVVPMPIGPDLTIIDVHPRYTKNLGEGPSFHKGPAAYFASEADQVTRKKSYSHYQTFLSNFGKDAQNAGPDYTAACLAEAKQPPVIPPTPKAKPDDASKLFNDQVEVPCNICSYWDGKKSYKFTDDKSHSFLPTSRPPGAKNWECNMEVKNGCHDFCSLNPKTGAMSYKRSPDAGLKIENKLDGKTYSGDICYMQLVR